MSEPDPPIALTPITRSAGLADSVADALAERILSGELAAGDSLPPERELVTEFGVSRTVIREAIRSLAGRGMVKPVGGSGVRVLALDTNTVGESLRDLLRSAQVEYETVDEVRSVLELAATSLAAVRADADDIARAQTALEQMRDQIDDLEACVDADLAFHRTIADATGNPLFAMLLDSLGAPLVDVRRANMGRGGVARRRRIIAEHRDVLDAVAAHDPERARAAMDVHLADVRQTLRSAGR